MEKFKKGTQYVDIVSAVGSNELTVVDEMNEDYQNLSSIKFIPASGAATRMFKDLYAYLDDQVETDFVEEFFDSLEDFAFYGELKQIIDIDTLNKDSVNNRLLIIDTVLNKMNYANLPKALLQFHQYGEESITPIDEHILEGELYLNKEDVNLHFTISEAHEDDFNKYVADVIENKNHVKITYSFQKEETDTVAATMENEPFILENGEVLTRPGGHGAIIENMNDLEEDIIFIKNVDNVCHRSQVEETIESKKQLASIGMDVKRQIDAYIESLLSNEYDLTEINEFLLNTLNITLKKELTKELAIEFLSRPLRVAGVVKNEGEPGGGPYVVDNGDYTDLQICETSEIDMSNPKQVGILNTAGYFNPVDLVCFVKDHKGEKFNLLDYVNEDRYFIAEKSHEGKPLKALEHPGLWNGAMHYWNTLFVEVPLETFNPVKTVNDLLKKGHRSLETVDMQ